MHLFDEICNQFNKYPGLSGVVKEIEPYKDNLESIIHYGMVLFGPDSFKQNEVFNIIDFFVQKGFELIAIKPKRISRTEAETLFLPTSTCVQCRSLKWWMIQDSASMGEFAAAIFYSDNATQNFNCLDQLNQYKGNSDPLKNKEGVVRHDFKAINVCLNLIHVPDTYCDFFKDTSPFFLVKELFSMFLTTQKNSLTKHFDLEKNLFLLELYSRQNSYCFEISCYKLKFFLLAKIFDKFKCSIVEDLSKHYRNVYYGLKNCQSREEKNDIFCSNILKEKSMISNVQNMIKNRLVVSMDKSNLLDNITAYQISELLFIMTDPNIFVLSGADFFEKISSYGIHLEAYEQLIVNTTLLQWKNRECKNDK